MELNIYTWCVRRSEEGCEVTTIFVVMRIMNEVMTMLVRWHRW